MLDLEGRGFKIAHDAHGPRMDPDTGDRTPSARAGGFPHLVMARRFPAFADGYRRAGLPVAEEISA